jgi:antitoxin (DNA-binding transcriptional repressor) of toxin-antitoxin stability system
MKVADVRDLKTHLSSYLREVAQGEVVLVTRQGRVLAELRPPERAGRLPSPADHRYWDMVDRGVIRPAATPGSMQWTGPGVRLRTGTPQELLDAERGE